jgi:cytosine/adenosine deaminase-related metal-dependent hydrolase
MRPTSLTLGARYVFPVEGAPIADGRLEIEDGRIARVGPASTIGREPDLDLGNVAIVPGFVNAHTHLELSPLDGDGPAGTAGTEDEIGWLRRVIGQRRGHLPGMLGDVVASNLSASLAAGTTTLADTTTAGLSWSAMAHAPLRGVVFTELIGLKRARGLQTSAEAWDWLAAIRSDQSRTPSTARLRPGLSPHAPYSTAGWLYQKAAESRLPLSTHLAEMPEEIELLERRDGPLRAFLEELGAWDDDWQPIGPRPGDYVRKGALRRADWLIAHGTYFDRSEFWQLRPEAAPGNHRVAVAFCPRTHARFGHAPHPFRAMLERGIIVCLGTDSLASSPSLGLLDEIRFLRRRDPTLVGPLLLTMATLFGAWALRAEAVTGSLKPGKSADLALIALPDRDAADPHDLLLDSDRPVIGTVFEGELVSGRWKEA